MAFFLRLVGAALAFGFNVLLARMLGAEGAGLYYLALTVTTIAGVLGRIGLDNSILRFVAANAALEDWGKVKGVYQKGMKMALGFSILVAAVTFVAAPWLAETLFLKPELTLPLRWMTLAIVPMALLILHAEVLKGLKRIRDCQLVRGLGFQALLILGFYLIGDAWGLKGAIFAYIAASVLMALAGFYLWRLALPQLREATGHFQTNELLKSCMPLFFASILNLVISSTSTFMLGIWSTSENVAIFNIALRTAMLTGFILVAINSIALPKFAALYHQGDIEALGSTARSSARLIFFLVSPIVLVLILFPGWILGIFGEQFIEGAAVLSIIALGQFINVTLGLAVFLLLMSGHERLMLYTVALAAVVNFILNLVLIPRYGITGAALAVTLSVVIQNLIAYYWVYKKINIHIIALPRFIRDRP